MADAANEPDICTDCLDPFAKGLKSISERAFSLKEYHGVFQHYDHWMDQLHELNDGEYGFSRHTDFMDFFDGWSEDKKREYFRIYNGISEFFQFPPGRDEVRYLSREHTIGWASQWLEFHVSVAFGEKYAKVIADMRTQYEEFYSKCLDFVKQLYGAEERPYRYHHPIQRALCTTAERDFYTLMNEEYGFGVDLSSYERPPAHLRDLEEQLYSESRKVKNAIDYAAQYTQMVSDQCRPKMEKTGTKKPPESEPGSTSTAATESGGDSDGQEEKNSKSKETDTKKPTADERMKAEIALNLEKVKGMSSVEWAKLLKVSRSTITDTPTWKSLALMREQDKAEKRADRHKR